MYVITLKTYGLGTLYRTREGRWAYPLAAINGGLAREYASAEEAFEALDEMPKAYPSDRYDVEVLG